MPNPLSTLHHAADAEFQSYADVEIVSTFGEPQAEYAAIRKSAALMDLPQRGVLELTGKDRLPFLNNLLTNQTYDKNSKTPMAAGNSVYAFLLSAKSGKIIADMNVLELGDRTLLETDARLIPLVKESLQKYQFAEQVKFGEVSKWHEIALHGPTAAGLLGITEDGVVTKELFGASVIVWRDDVAGVPGYHLLVPVDAILSVWNGFLEMAVRDTGLWPVRATPESQPSHGPEDPVTENSLTGKIRRKLRPIGWAAFNAARIEAGRAMFGIDFDDTVLPAETGQLARAVSFTKGCYPGQEIVARMHARQVVAKQIAGLKFADDALPIAGAPVTDDAGNAIGGITSSTISPMLSNTAIAIALLKRPFFAVGTVVNVPAEGAMRKAVVAEMPFV